VTRDELANALAFLPHGAEFRFITHLTELDPGKTGRAEFVLRGDEAFLRGHFPNDPLMPGVLLVEAAAQLAGVIAQTDPGLKPLEGLKLTAIRGAKIAGTARPGETILLEGTVTGRLDNLVQATAKAVVSGRVILETTITLSGERS
jgi:3-hydroxyacyl-[acyl-carrier-protein] dehydratase